MGVTITPIVCAIRFGKHHNKYGDEFTGSAVVQITDNVAWIQLLSGNYGDLSSERLNLYEILKTLNVEYVEFERIKNGEKRKYRHKIVR